MCWQYQVGVVALQSAVRRLFLHSSCIVLLPGAFAVWPLSLPSTDFWLLPFLMQRLNVYSRQMRKCTRNWISPMRGMGFLTHAHRFCPLTEEQKRKWCKLNVIPIIWGSLRVWHEWAVDHGPNYFMQTPVLLNSRKVVLKQRNFSVRIICV